MQISLSNPELEILSKIKDGGRRHLGFIWFRLKSPIHAPKISVFGAFYPQNLGAHRSDPQKALPCERRVLSPHWSRSDEQFDQWPWQRKKDSGKLAIRTDHPRCRTEFKVCMPGGFLCVVLYLSFIKIGSVVLPLWVVENRPSPLLWPLAYTTACTVNSLYYRTSNSLYYRTSRDKQFLWMQHHRSTDKKTGIISHCKLQATLARSF